jgi:hypothetical protein
MQEIFPFADNAKTGVSQIFPISRFREHKNAFHIAFELPD